MVNIARIFILKKSATDTLKTSSKRIIQRTAEATGDLNGNKIANRITKVSKNLNKIIQRQLQMSMIKKYLNKNVYLQKKQQLQMTKERYISPEKRQTFIDNLR